MRTTVRILGLLMLSISLTALWGCEDDEVGPTPITEFSADKRVVEVAEPVNFSNLTSIDNNSQLTYEWDFGDGTTSTNASPVKSYTNTGEYIVTLTASSGGQMMDFTDTVTVGARFLTAILVIDMPFQKLLDPNDTILGPWDEDGTGPDLVIQFGRSSEQEWDLQNPNPLEDLGENDLPLGLSITGDYMLSDELYDFYLLDDDDATAEPIFGGFELFTGVQEELTAHLNENGDLAEGKDPETGEGFILFGNQASLVFFLFEVRVP